MQSPITQAEPNACTLDVIYEDNHLIAVVKPAGIPIQADGMGECLLEAVRSLLKIKYAKPGDVFVGLLHRLDKPVRGVVLFAKTSKGASRLSEQFRARSVGKVYYALVEGRVEPVQARLVHFLGSDGTHGVVTRLEAGPDLKRAELQYRVHARGSRFTLLEIKLETGRKHQIRAQLGAIGHPVAGDRKYGARLDFPGPGIGLVSYGLQFQHPVRREERVALELARHPEEEWRAWL